MEAKAKAAALEIKAAFLEENVYKQFEMEQNIDGMNDYLETMKVKYTSTPISSQAISCNQATLPVVWISTVTAGKLQVPAVVNSVNTISMVTPSTTHITTSVVFTTSAMNPSAQPFVPGNLFTEVEQPEIPIVAEQSHDKQESEHLSRRDSSSIVNDSNVKSF